MEGKIDVDLVKNLFLAGAQNLIRNKELLNALNVFPVPDGDTGTNMGLTISAAVKEVKELQHATLNDLGKAMANGALMGARGNSGVILSQLFRGFCKVLEQQEELNSSILVEAFESAVHVAYKAVLKPVEGTILTVAKGAASGAKKAALETDDCKLILLGALKASEAMLARTPEMLPALARAGVVDAGGKGLCCILAGAYAALDESFVLEEDFFETTNKPSMDQMLLTDELEFHYCTELFVKGSKLDELKIRKDLSAMGDSLLVVTGAGFAKVHVHTNNPGNVLEYLGELGSLHDIKIDNMAEQHSELQSKHPEVEAVFKPEKDFGIVSVAAGKGLEEILGSMGVDEVIFGGQTMNPSTEDIVKAIKKLNARTVFVLPNNKNIILAAEQAKYLIEGCDVRVIPSKSFPQGMSALMAYIPGAEVEKNIKNMTAALAQVKSGELTFAVRESSYEDKKISEGDFLGLADGKIKTNSKDLSEAMFNLLVAMEAEHADLLTIYYGKDIDENTAEEMQAMINKQYPALEIELYQGGQPLYYYLLSLE
ncbi:MAG: DAK2 domain-containing protein [Clostridia bacterium]